MNNEHYELIGRDRNGGNRIMAKTKVDNKLNVVIGTKAQVEADNTIPKNSIIVVTDEELTASDITQDANNRFVTDNEKSTWNNKVEKNNAITAGTKAKITYDSKGLVTAGADLVESDIPQLAISKITGLQTALDDIEQNGVPYITTAPTSANTNGKLITVVLTSEPTTKYAGYFYIITEE